MFCCCSVGKNKTSCDSQELRYTTVIVPAIMTWELPTSFITIMRGYKFFLMLMTIPIV